MSHGPESHHEHAKIIGPDDDGFNWPLVEKIDKDGNSHRVMHPTTYATTHRYPDGHYYTIDDNKDVSAGGNRVYDEAHVKNPLKYGLYRTGMHGALIRPELPSHDDTRALDIGSTAVDSQGYVYKTNDEKRDIDARATPIIASYEARDRALKEGRSMREAQAIGSEVYAVHFGMAGPPSLLRSSRYPELPSSQRQDQEQLYGSSTSAPEEEHQRPSEQRRRRFGRSATNSTFREPSPRTQNERQRLDEASDFLRDIRRLYPKSAWLKEISDDDMSELMKDVRAQRQQLIKEGVVDKQKQDRKIYRDYRMQLELDQNAEATIKQSNGVLWDLMRENPSGDIPF